MSSKSIRFCWSLAVVLVTGAILISGVYPPSVKASAGAKTTAQIRSLYVTLERKYQTQSNTFYLLSVAERNGVTLPMALSLLLSGKDLNGSAPTNYWPLLDYWGEPLMVCWRSNILGMASTDLLREHGLLIIWSKGANRSNEWGRGDDVFMRPM
jgi:hypothetical protein